MLKGFIKNLLEKLFISIFPEVKFYLDKIKHHNLDISLVLDHIDEVDPSVLKERDEIIIKDLYEKKFNKNLNLDEPETLSEKFQWLKINYRKKHLSSLVDKYEVRNYIKEKGFEKYLNELYGVYGSSSELLQDWESLPQTFAVKVNHWAGVNFLINNKNTFDKKKLQKADELLKKNYYHEKRWGEWAYKNIKPCIMVEKFLEEGESGTLKDYRLFCFNGTVRLIEVDDYKHVKNGGLTSDVNKKRQKAIDAKPRYQGSIFYDVDWNKHENIWDSLHYEDDFKYDGDIKKPKVLREMIAFAETVSSDFPFLRVDLYVIDTNKIVFGELTFFDGGGFYKYAPDWDKKLGDMLVLPAEFYPEKTKQAPQASTLTNGNSV